MGRILFLIIPLLTFVYACGNDPGTDSIKPGCSITYENGAEVKTDSWDNAEYIKTDSNAHSGNHVCVTDSAMPFSLVLKKTLGTIFAEQVRSVVFSAWIYSDSLASFKGLSMVVSVDGDSATIFYRDFSIDYVITEAKKWYYVSRIIPMRFDQHSADVFKGYILNNSKKKVLVDDITFRFIKK